MELMKENSCDLFCKDGAWKKEEEVGFIRTMIDYISHCSYFLCQCVNVWQGKHVVIKKLQAHASTSEN